MCNNIRIDSESEVSDLMEEFDFDIEERTSLNAFHCGVVYAGGEGDNEQFRCQSHAGQGQSSVDCPKCFDSKSLGQRPMLLPNSRNGLKSGKNILIELTMISK